MVEDSMRFDSDESEDENGNDNMLDGLGSS